MAVKKRYIRQSSIINIEEVKENLIAIIGCGAIGSYTAVSLAKMGMQRFLIYDHDKIEEHNLPNQFFNCADVGLSKVIATRNMMSLFNEEAEIFMGGEFTEKDSLQGCHIVVCSVDTMKARKTIFKNAKKDDVQLFIDTRMGALEGQVYAVDMEDPKEIKEYEKSLFTDKEAVTGRCTERAIIFTVLGISSIVCSLIVKALKEEEISNFTVIDYKQHQMM